MQILIASLDVYVAYTKHEFEYRSKKYRETWDPFENRSDNSNREAFFFQFLSDSSCS